ncbi:PTS sugar transporter subunit IIA, partial [Klebsiella pneumoniae]|uniref:PTS sugar transporter subunit IIA n=1 Tax=Klebsiella pneumoniae TaxID=573 RepID=UPI0040555A75
KRAYCLKTQPATGETYPKSDLFNKAALMARFPAQDELIVITDIFAGSVNNEFVRFLSRPHFHLLSGLNLPLIIDLLISAAEDNTEKLITEALTNAKESIQYCNQTIASAMTMDKDF